MPVLDRDRWRQLEPLLDRALDLEPAERASWLAELAVSEPGVAADLGALLEQHAAAERAGFLARPMEVSLAGLELGGYTLERSLGQGGSGSVWLARRSDGRFEGRAAVKLLNLALVTREGQERFRREGSVLARLAHPGIARLLDAGLSPSGQPYLVLEYVDGQRIDQYVQERRLTIEARVRLFLQVLDAVGHAHANLIVHRDLKPSNILVTADGRVTLLDFGIAKLLDNQSQDAEGRDRRISLTGEGGGALTPEFAAPEQATGEAITTATDVYSSGVLLYLLLSGRHPTAEGCATRAEVLLALQERQPLPLGLGDLDTVLAKALRKDAAERYVTIAGLADDLERWLRHQPVSARPQSLAYRARKLVRRNRTAASAAALGVLLLAAYVAMVIVDRARVRAALAEATTATRKAEQVTDFTVSLFERGERGSAVADTVTAQNLLARGEQRARELSGQPAIEAQMLDLIGRVRTQLGDYEEARRLFEDALAIRRKALGEQHPDVATSRLHLGSAMVLGEKQPTAGIPLLRDAFETRRRLFGERDARTLEALYELASGMHIAGDFRGAGPLMEQWAAAMEDESVEPSPARAEQLGDLANILEFSGRLDRAERLAREALAMDRALYGDQHHRIGASLTRLGGILNEAGKHAPADSALRAAVALLRASHPAGHPELGNALRDLALHLNDANRSAEAEPVWRETANIYKRAYGDKSLVYAQAMLQIGYTEGRLGRFVDAEHTVREALAQLELTMPRSNFSILRGRAYLGEALRAQGRFAEAEPILLQVYRAPGTSRLVRDHRRYAASSLVRLYEAQGRTEEAAKYRLP